MLGRQGCGGWTEEAGLPAGASSQGRRWGTRRPVGSSWPCAGSALTAAATQPAPRSTGSVGTREGRIHSQPGVTAAPRDTLRSHRSPHSSLRPPAWPVSASSRCLASTGPALHSASQGSLILRLLGGSQERPLPPPGGPFPSRRPMREGAPLARAHLSPLESHYTRGACLSIWASVSPHSCQQRSEPPPFICHGHPTPVGAALALGLHLWQCFPRPKLTHRAHPAISSTWAGI